MTNGVLRGVEHFDSKAEVAEYIETIKGDMVATYFMPGFSTCRTSKECLTPDKTASQH
jgi:hypothetical protein